MKEILELRVNYDYAHLLFKPEDGKIIENSVQVVRIFKDDPRYDQIPIVERKIQKKDNMKMFFSYWHFERLYTKEELNDANLFHISVKPYFEPSGELCGMEYDEAVACSICGVGRRQIGPLKLKKNSIPKNKDIACTIERSTEIVVSQKFKTAFEKRKLKGIRFDPVVFGENISTDYYQLVPVSELELTSHTITGVNPWNFSEGSEGGTHEIQKGYKITFEKEVYKCPRGHLIGLNLLSEPYVSDSPAIKEYDFFASTQKVGVKVGLLRPSSIYLCSPAFRNMVLEEKLKGFDFEVAHIE